MKRKERAIELLENKGFRGPYLRPGERTGPNIVGQRVEFTSNGMRITEQWHVTGLDPDFWQVQALMVPGTPRPELATPHPFYTFLPCTRATAEPVEGSPTQALTTIEYGTPSEGFAGIIPPDPEDEPDISIRTTMQSFETNLHYLTDSGGNEYRTPIRLQQSFIVEDPDSGTSTEVNVDQSPIVEVSLPMTTFVYRRTEFWERTSGDLVGQTIGDLARRFVGRVNGTHVFGDVLYSWMCTAIVGASSDGGRTYDVEYEFQHHPVVYTGFNNEALGGWVTPVGITDEQGYPRPDLELGDGTADNPGGLAYVRVHRSDDFELLQLYI